MITINDRDFLQLVQFVRNNFGINLEHKRQLVDARLSFEIKRRGYTDFSDYIFNVITNPECEECRNMINRISTNYTFFFREPEYIEKLCGDVLNDFISRGKSLVRIWCAACSSGEEAYSIAMALEAYRETYHMPFDFEITGTDINTDMLELAQSGRYCIEELTFIPDRYRHYTALHTTSTFEICDKIRKNVKWKYENLMDKSSVNDEYDIIFCRNVMIYFTPDLRQKMTGKLYLSLVQGGYLFTGSTESIDLERKYFRYIAPTFYQKR